MRNMFADTNRLEVEIAFRYYYEQKTQGEIAKEMGLSRIKVQRLLQKCMDLGIVRISIQDPLVNCVRLEKELLARFGLKEAHVVASPSNTAYTKKQIALQGAKVFDFKLRDNMTVGVAWGRMVFELVSCLQPSAIKGLHFVSLIGGLTTKFSLNPFTIIHRLGDNYQADVSYLSAPALVESPDLKGAILGERSMQPVFQHMKMITLALAGIGNVGEESTLFKTNYLTREELEDLQEMGAVGEVLLFHYDINGKPVGKDFTDRLIGLGEKRLKRIDTVIGVAGGKEKVDPILGAMRGNYINVLVTDERTAEMILAHSTSNPV